MVDLLHALTLVLSSVMVHVLCRSLPVNGAFLSRGYRTYNTRIQHRTLLTATTQPARIGRPRQRLRLHEARRVDGPF
jgi:hypothetical protein